MISGRMPAPVSLTTIRAVPSIEARLTSILPPRGVNLMALLSRLLTTCCKRVGSPCTGFRSPAADNVMAISLASAEASATLTASCTTVVRSTA